MPRSWRISCCRRRAILSEQQDGWRSTSRGSRV
jgi:hypothetical protein